MGSILATTLFANNGIWLNTGKNHQHSDSNPRVTGLYLGIFLDSRCFSCDEALAPRMHCEENKTCNWCELFEFNALLLHHQYGFPRIHFWVTAYRRLWNRRTELTHLTGRCEEFFHRNWHTLKVHISGQNKSYDFVCPGTVGVRRYGFGGKILVLFDWCGLRHKLRYTSMPN